MKKKIILGCYAIQVTLTQVVDDMEARPAISQVPFCPRWVTSQKYIYLNDSVLKYWVCIADDRDDRHT